MMLMRLREDRDDDVAIEQSGGGRQGSRLRVASSASLASARATRRRPLQVGRAPVRASLICRFASALQKYVDLSLIEEAKKRIDGK